MKNLINKREMLFAATAIVAMTALMVDPAMAQATAIDQTGGFAANSDIGDGVRNVFSDVLFGNLGLVAGVFFAAFGAYMWLVKQETWVGIGSLLFGAVLALSDNLMDGLFNTIADPLSRLLGSN